MMGELLVESWVSWAVGIAIAFPLAMLITGEIRDRFGESGRSLQRTISWFRGGVLPSLAVFLLMTQVLGMPTDSVWVQLVSTALAIGILQVLLSGIGAVLFDRVEDDSWRSRVPQLFLDLVRGFLVVVGIVGILSVIWGRDVGGFLTALGVGSIVIGLALQDTLGNLMSGIAILFERPFRVGDWVRVGDTEGAIVEMNWRSVQLSTRDRDMLVVPNLSMCKDVIRNYGRPHKLHMERIPIGFSYDDPPGKVKASMLRIVRDVPGVLASPPPEVFTLSYDDFSIGYEIRVFTEGYADIPRIRDTINSRIWYAARRYGLNIPFPIRTLHHFDGPKLQEEDGRHISPERLKSSPVLGTLDDETLHPIAEGSRLESYAAGERLIDIGSRTSNLCTVISGRAKIIAKTADGEEQTVQEIGRGEFFGALSLMQNQPSPVAVEAITDMEVVAIAISEAREMLQRNRSLNREFARLIESRQEAVQRSLQKLTP